MKRTFVCFFLVMMPLSLFGLSLQRAVFLAYENLYDLKYLSNSIILQRREVTGKIMNLFPEVNISTSLSSSRQEDSFSQDISLSARLSYPLYDGGNRGRALEIERVKLHLLKLRYRIRKREIRSEVEGLFLEALFGREARRMREQKLTQALQEKERAQAMYREGLMDRLTWLYAGQYYFISYRRLHEAILEENIKRLNLLAYLRLDGDVEIDEAFTTHLIEVDKEVINVFNDYRWKQLEIRERTARLNYQFQKQERTGWRLHGSVGGSVAFDNWDFTNMKPRIETRIDFHLPLFDFLTLRTTPSFSSDFSNHSASLSTGIEMEMDGVSLSVTPGYNTDFMKSEGYNVGITLTPLTMNRRKTGMMELHNRHSNQLNQLDHERRKLVAEIRQIPNRIRVARLSVTEASNSFVLAGLNYTRVKTLFETGDKTAKDVLEARVGMDEAEIGWLRSIYNFNRLIIQVMSYQIEEAGEVP